MKAHCLAFASGLLALPAMAQSPSLHPRTSKDYSTADYIRQCDGPNISLVPCMTAFGTVQTAPGHPAYCAPDTSSDDPEEGKRNYSALIVSLISWLKKHPEYLGRPYPEGLSAALRGRYPCQQ